MIRTGAARFEFTTTEVPVLARSLTLAAHGFVFSAMTMTDHAVGLADLDAEFARLVTASLEPRAT